jgi:hypothetical protein
VPPPGPFQPGDGISSSIVFQQYLDGIDYFGPFFHGLVLSLQLIAIVFQRHFYELCACLNAEFFE